MARKEAEDNEAVAQRAAEDAKAAEEAARKAADEEAARKEAEEREHRAREEQIGAAQNIQRIYRGRSARKRSKRMTKSRQRRRVVEAGSATRIQAMYRSRRDRRRVTEIRAKKGREKEVDRKLKEDEVETIRLQEHQQKVLGEAGSARRIQSIYRGRRDRKRVHEIRSKMTRKKGKEEQEETSRSRGPLEQDASQVQSSSEQKGSVQQENWSKVFDEESQQYYFLDTVSGRSQWEEPERLVGGNAKSPSVAGGGWKARLQRSTPTNKKIGAWTQFLDPVSNAFYYHNTATGESTWDPPVGFKSTGTTSEGLTDTGAAALAAAKEVDGASKVRKPKLMSRKPSLTVKTDQEVEEQGDQWWLASPAMKAQNRIVVGGKSWQELLDTDSGYTCTACASANFTFLRLRT